MKYLIVGATGLMGTTFLDKVKSSVGVDEKTMDITDKKSVEKYFEENSDKFDTVINFAAYTNVDGAEKEKGDETGLVWKINVEGAKNLAEVCKENGKYLIQISTDFVFVGSKENPGPYKEDASTSDNMEGIGWYGWTKLQGEKAVQSVGGEASVVRTAYPFRAKPFELKKDYAHGVLSLFDEGKLYPLFVDQELTPVLLEDLVEALKKIAEKKYKGVLHVATSDSTTPFNFGTYLIEKARGKKGVVKEGSMEEFMKVPGRFPRPVIGGLDTKKTEEILGMKFRTWKEAVDEFVRLQGKN